MKISHTLRTLPAVLIVSFATLFGSPSLQAAPALGYNRDVRPILSDACFQCHGPDEKERKGGLRLDVRDEAIKPAKSGARAVVPGKTAESELLARVQSTDSEEVMPPPKSHKKISAAQIAILKQWIEEGAPYELHWAFVPLKPVAVPAIKQAARVRNPVDAFVLHSLERTGLTASAEAPRETLLRRVTLDLTGLPPTPAEVTAFVQDTAPDAYERVVDRLLQSPRYGERMAVDWLDAARYADSNGYQVDRDRDVWPWRDWVIEAFNRNLSFDRFTIEQVAGDLLPNPTQSQRIATGFHRNHMMNEEGGVIGAEFLAEYTADRVETTAAVWLGQTFNCTRCHDHKYDPFTQKDFYSLKAFFHNVPEQGVGAYGQNYRVSNPPFLKLPSAEQQKELDALQKQIAESTKRLGEIKTAHSAALPAWIEKIASQQTDWAPLALDSATGLDAEIKASAGDSIVAVTPAKTANAALTITLRLPPGEWTALCVEFGADKGEASLQLIDLKLNTLTHPQADASRKKSKPLSTPVPWEPAAEGNSLAAAELSKINATGKNARAVLDAKPNAPVRLVMSLDKPLAGGPDAPPVELVVNAAHPAVAAHWRVQGTRSEKDLLVPESLRTAARKAAAQRTGAETGQLTALHTSFNPAYQAESRELEKFKKRLNEVDQTVPTSLVMEEMKQTRPTFVLMRGAYDKPGAEVSAATPAVLPPLPEGEPANRLGLARWLVHPGNPLTARVTVNRFWQAVFGAGLVRTAEDFGSQGELPSHPELLDWLANEFIRSGWDVKAFMRMLVTSATYRQSSKLNAELLQKDPANRLLSRGPRFRIQAEFVRDQALAAAGLLSATIGGPPAKPYHPPGLYEQVTAGSGTNRWVEGKGEDLYRRSMYTYWKRSVPHPSMLLFDAPFRETCTLRRPRSNTPLQALNLMNDPTYVEACKGIAQRMLREGGASSDEQLAHGFRLLLARSPKPAELAILQKAYTRNLERFQSHPEDAKAFLQVGALQPDPGLNPAETAALAAVASAILNSDEWITKE